MNDTASNKALKPLNDWMDRLNVGAVFGEPVHEGNSVVIPVASLTMGFGYGAGSPPPQAASQDDQKPASGESAGGGGGGSLQPRGYLRITADDVKYEPIMNTTLVSLAGIIMAAWNVFWIARAIRAFAPKTPRSEE